MTVWIVFLLGRRERIVGCCESDADEEDVASTDLNFLFFDGGLQVVDRDGPGLEGFDFAAVAGGP